MIPTIVHIPVPFGGGGIPIHSFGLMMVLAFMSAWRLLCIELEEAGKDTELAERMVTWAAIGGIVGARVGYLLSFPTELMSHPLRTIFSEAGFVFHWGLIGGAFGVWLLLRKVGEDFLSFGDLSGAALALGYAVGRIGCQLSGDGDYGKPTDLPWGMEYPLGVVPTPPGVAVHPAPVYETLLALLVVFILRSPRVRQRLPGRGRLFGLYFVLMSAERVAVEFVRIEPIVLPPFTQAQMVSILLALIGLTLIFRKSHAGGIGQ